MPNNNKCIESQLMKKFLMENAAITYTQKDEFTNHLLPLFPKKVDTGSYAETIAKSSAKASQLDLTIQSLDYELPKYHSLCLLSSFQKALALRMYAELYDVPDSDVEITDTCTSYKSVMVKGKFYGCLKSQTASSSMVVAQSSSGERAARIEKIVKHTAQIREEVKTHLLAFVSWFETYRSVGKPVSVWCLNDTYYGFIPVQSIVCRSVTSEGTLKGESVLFVVPCV